MENQMKICFISIEQYNKIWAKLQPQERFMTDLTTMALMSRRFNTLFIVGQKEDFIAAPEERIPQAWMVVAEEPKAA